MGASCWPNLVLLVFCVGNIAADDNNGLIQRLGATEDLVKTLVHRIDQLESREKVHLDRIADLETRDAQKQNMIDELKQQLKELHHFREPIDGASKQTMDNKSEVETKTELHSGSYVTNHTFPAIKERSVQRIRQAEIESPVAFWALLGNHFEHAGIKQIFVFEQVVTNVGNGYNNSVGMFTAPVEGIYVFSTTLVSFHHINAHASFYRNADSLNIMFVSGGEAGYDTTSATITLHLQKGDIITVRNGDVNVSYYGYKHCSFSGFLLTDLTNAQTIVG